MVGRMVNLGALRRNPNRPASVRTVDSYRACLTRVARDLARDGRELRDLTPETAIAYLRTREDFGQKHLDMHRQAIQGHARTRRRAASEGHPPSARLARDGTDSRSPSTSSPRMAQPRTASACYARCSQTKTVAKPQ